MRENISYGARTAVAETLPAARGRPASASPLDVLRTTRSEIVFCTCTTELGWQQLCHCQPEPEHEPERIPGILNFFVFVCFVFFLFLFKRKQNRSNFTLKMIHTVLRRSTSNVHRLRSITALSHFYALTGPGKISTKLFRFKVSRSHRLSFLSLTYFGTMATLASSSMQYNKHSLDQDYMQVYDEL